MLQQFYDDPQRYAYTFQNYVFITRVMQVCYMPKQPSYKPAASETCNPTTETLAPLVSQLMAELRRGS
jgi:Deoxynucleoside kinase